MVTTKVFVLHNSFLMGHWRLFSYISSTPIKILNVEANRKNITVCLGKKKNFKNFIILICEYVFILYKLSANEVMYHKTWQRTG